MIHGRPLQVEPLPIKEKYRPSRIPQPPPGPKEIDAWLALPLAPEVAECLACNWSACLESLYEHGKALRSQCMKSLTVDARPHAINPTAEDRAQEMLAILRKGPCTIPELIRQSGATYDVVRHALDYLRCDGRVVAASLGKGKRCGNVWSVVNES